MSSPLTDNSTSLMFGGGGTADSLFRPGSYLFNPIEVKLHFFKKLLYISGRFTDSCDCCSSPGRDFANSSLKNCRVGSRLAFAYLNDGIMASSVRTGWSLRDLIS